MLQIQDNGTGIRVSLLLTYIVVWLENTYLFVTIDEESTQIEIVCMLLLTDIKQCKLVHLTNLYFVMFLFVLRNNI